MATMWYSIYPITTLVIISSTCQRYTALAMPTRVWAWPQYPAGSGA